jgi:hypothetical protein
MPFLGRAVKQFFELVWAWRAATELAHILCHREFSRRMKYFVACGLHIAGLDWEISLQRKVV